MIDGVDWHVFRHGNALEETVRHGRDLLETPLVFVPVILCDIIGLRGEELNIALGQRGIGDTPFGERHDLDAIAGILEHFFGNSGDGCEILPGHRTHGNGLFFRMSGECRHADHRGRAKRLP
ncbi:hypothetical protein D3C78_1271390 [compost metagenome]